MKRPSRTDLRRAAEALDSTAAMSEESHCMDAPGTSALRDEAAPDRESWRLVAEWLRSQTR